MRKDRLCWDFVFGARSVGRQPARSTSSTSSPQAGSGPRACRGAGAPAAGRGRERVADVASLGTLPTNQPIATAEFEAPDWLGTKLRRCRSGWAARILPDSSRLAVAAADIPMKSRRVMILGNERERPEVTNFSRGANRLPGEKGRGDADSPLQKEARRPSAGLRSRRRRRLPAGARRTTQGGGSSRLTALVSSPIS